MSKNQLSVALIPDKRTRYDKLAIYHDGKTEGLSCDIETIISEFGCDKAKWQANPRCMMQGYPQVDNDLMISFYLPVNENDAQFSTKIISDFFNPRGIKLERI